METLSEHGHSTTPRLSSNCQQVSINRHSVTGPVMAPETALSRVNRDDKFFTNPDLNRLTRWRRLLLSYVTETDRSDWDLIFWLIQSPTAATGSRAWSGAATSAWQGDGVTTSGRRSAA